MEEEIKCWGPSYLGISPDGSTVVIEWDATSAVNDAQDWADKNEEAVALYDAGVLVTMFVPGRGALQVA